MNKALIILLLLSSRSFAFQFNFPQDTIAYNDRFNNRQSAAFDSEGNIHVAYSGQIGTTSTTREIYYVTDSAGTFSSRQVTLNSVDDNYPTLVVDGDNNVHIGFLGRDAGNQFQVQYSRVVNGAFTTPIFITTAGLNKATPYCAVDRDSVVHFVYHTFPPAGTQNAYYRTYDVRDSTLSAEQLLTDASVTGDFDAAIATDTLGFVHIVVKSGTTSGGLMKYFTNRTGTLVETPTGVSVLVDYPRILVDRRNVVHILYRNSPTEVLYLVNNASGTFGTPVPLTPAGQRPAGYHNFAVDDESRLYVVYQSSVATSGRGWFLVHGKDGVFSDTVQVADLPPGYLTRNTSTVVARGNGEIAVTYAAGASRGGSVVCDIFMKQGFLKTTVVVEGPSGLASFTLSQNYPNPFNPETRIRFSVADRMKTVVEVFNAIGQRVAILYDDVAEPGRYYERMFDGRNLASGIYFYRLKSGTFVDSKKLLLLR